jgi:hypothetical protein
VGSGGGFLWHLPMVLFRAAHSVTIAPPIKALKLNERDGSRRLQLIKSTFSGNSANRFRAGGGIFIGSGNGTGNLTISSSTIANYIGANGGGVTSFSTCTLIVPLLHPE